MVASDLSIVVLNCPFNGFGDPKIDMAFGAIIALKRQGYQAAYGKTTLPVGAADFIGTHIAIYHGDTPLMVYKSITLRQCDRYKEDFPTLLLTKSPNSKSHRDSVELVLNRCRNDGVNIVYGGGMTIEPGVRKDKALVALLWEIIIAVSISYDLENGISEAMTAGVCKFKLDRLFHKMGYKDMENDGAKLPPIPVSFVDNEEVILYHRTQISEEALALVQKYKFLWEARTEIMELREEIKTAA